MLASWGMLPTVASRAREGLHMMREAVREHRPFRLVLSDTHMPEMDGFMLAEQIGKDPKIGQTAIILLTSGDRPEDMERCEQSGIAAYLLKPVKQSELFDAIVEALEITHEGETAEALMSHHPKLTTPRRILLAEDSVVNQKLAVALLERFGHKVTVANNGREATEAAASDAFDVVLMDIQMPEMDGLEATAKIRAREKTVGRHIPIIAMTAHALKGDRELCLAAGMDDYVSKPIRREELFEKLARLVPDVSPVSVEEEVHGETSNKESADREGVIDWTQIRDLTGGDSELLKSLIADGLEEASRLLKEIRDSIAKGDREHLRTAAHTLKGSVRYFGADKLFEIIVRLEALARQGNPDEIADVQRSLENELDVVISLLQSRLKEMS
jgi:CheY-like chemotaxis protein/HPt (histidine-containing phosphotransfer) domain-containing protein